MYKKITDLAIPYYKKGRAGDIEHIAWLQEKLLGLKKIIEEKGYDFDIIFALTILHDIGYSKMPAGYNPFDLEIRKLHAKASANIAVGILQGVGFPEEKMHKTLHLIKHHDDWALGGSLEDPEWRIFNDLDFSWEASLKGFDIVRAFLGQSRKNFLQTVIEHYKTKQDTRPFFLEQSKELFLQDLEYWKQQV